MGHKRREWDPRTGKVVSLDADKAVAQLQLELVLKGTPASRDATKTRGKAVYWSDMSPIDRKRRFPRRGGSGDLLGRRK